MQIDLLSDGVAFAVRVIPRASKPGIAGVRDGALLVRVGAPPVENAANDELVGVIADALGVPRRRVTILSGARGRLKRVQVVGADASLVARLRTVG